MGLQPCLSCFSPVSRRWNEMKLSSVTRQQAREWTIWSMKWLILEQIQLYPNLWIWLGDILTRLLGQMAWICLDFGWFWGVSKQFARHKKPGEVLFYRGNSVLERTIGRLREDFESFSKQQVPTGCFTTLDGWLEDASSTTWWCLIHLMDIVYIVFVISSQSILMSGVTLIQKVHPIGDSKCFRQSGATSPYRWSYGPLTKHRNLVRVMRILRYWQYEWIGKALPHAACRRSVRAPKPCPERQLQVNLVTSYQFYDFLYLIIYIYL